MASTNCKNRHWLSEKSRLGALALSGILFLNTAGMAQLIGDPVDVSLDFEKLEQVFFIGNRITSYDPAKGTGALEWARHLRQPGLSFNKLDLGFSPARSSDFPGAGYDENPSLPFSISFLTGYYEHNLYPLRYNKAVAEITKAVTGDSIIWARSAWAGSQRYPLHWGGDAENSNSAMAATLRAGLSFGLSGFTFWSHDVGGFVQAPSRDLYRRWLPFGVLTSHTRCHGVPPREPWAFDEAFVEDFRRALELKYSLMPYIYAQAKDSAGRGLPMLRALFLEYPDDPTSWLIDDVYLLGSDLLVAPLIEEGSARKVYLPPGAWIDYQSGKAYPGGRWHSLGAGAIPIILLVKDHSAIPQARVAQSTAAINWKEIELRVFSTDRSAASGLFTLPDGSLQTLSLDGAQGGFVLKEDPFRGQVKWQINRVEIQ